MIPFDLTDLASRVPTAGRGRIWAQSAQMRPRPASLNRFAKAAPYRIVAMSEISNG